MSCIGSPFTILLTIIYYTDISQIIHLFISFLKVSFTLIMYVYVFMCSCPRR